MPEEIMTNKGGMGWPLTNTVGWVAALGSALGIGIPALVKANDAQDDERRGRGRRFDPENDVVYLQSKIYTDSKIAEQQKEISGQSTRIALLEQANLYKDQIAALREQNMRLYVDGTFVKGSLLLPPTSIGQGLPPFPPPVFPPIPPASGTTSSSTSSTTTSGNG